VLRQAPLAGLAVDDVARALNRLISNCPKP